MESKRWYEHLQSYTEIVAIEFERKEDVLPILEHIHQKMRPCPYDLASPDIVVVPIAAIALLPLENIPHLQVELRDMFAVSSEVCREISRRGYVRQEPNYYVTQYMVQPPTGPLKELLEKTGRPVPTHPEIRRTFHRMFVRLTTVREIEEQLAVQTA